MTKMTENRFMNNEERDRPSNEKYIRGASNRAIFEDCAPIIEA